jgi:hypothetical protein
MAAIRKTCPVREADDDVADADNPIAGVVEVVVLLATFKMCVAPPTWSTGTAVADMEPLVTAPMPATNVIAVAVSVGRDSERIAEVRVLSAVPAELAGTVML